MFDPNLTFFTTKTMCNIKMLKLAKNFNKLLNKYRFYCTGKQYEFNLKVRGVALKNYVKTLQNEYETNQRNIQLQPLIHALKNRENLVKDLVSLNEIFESNDEELKALADKEKSIFCDKLKKLDEEVLELLLNDVEEPSFDSLILEIQAGVGGQEAMLFAKEMSEMYQKFSLFKGFTFEIADYLTSEIGGLRAASLLIDGYRCYDYFKHEAGIHRVQRIPATEKSGRVHTSTVSVAVLPRSGDIRISLDSKDLKIETKRSSGAGGQHVNKTESAVRITHLPSGVSVECQEDRSQIRNRKIALAKLEAILYENLTGKLAKETCEMRKIQVQGRNRNEKIRTYNFKDDRVTDHRISMNVFNLEKFFQGEEALENLMKKLEESSRLDDLLKKIERMK